MPSHLHPDEIRTLFSRAMSDMYQAEVPQYGALLSLVRDVNEMVLSQNPDLRARMTENGEMTRLDVERHGAIRVGSAQELSTIARMFAVMGMAPVGYYDLSVAGLPVHSTAFRPIEAGALNRNPFRVFTSLLRLDLVEDQALAAEAESILSARQIFTPRALELIAQAETDGGLDEADGQEFVAQTLETFRWHAQATVSMETYNRLLAAHRLIADIVCFPGPHINHLTPRTLDIDMVQQMMPERGIAPKEVIEGPPRRQAGILLRQTSFKALEEAVSFPDGAQTDGAVAGTHTARFGEIEQRGAALTPRGRALYDDVLAQVRTTSEGKGPDAYAHELSAQFATAFPDSWDALRGRGLAYFRYSATARGLTAKHAGAAASVDALIEAGHLRCEPQTYEDFLPVSAAGIFRSNLDEETRSNYHGNANRAAFEQALGMAVHDEMALYAQIEATSLHDALTALGQDSSARPLTEDAAQ